MGSCVGMVMRCCQGRMVMVARRALPRGSGLTGLLLLPVRMMARSQGRMVLVVGRAPPRENGLTLSLPSSRNGASRRRTEGMSALLASRQRSAPKVRVSVWGLSVARAAADAGTCDGLAVFVFRKWTASGVVLVLVRLLVLNAWVRLESVSVSFSPCVLAYVRRTAFGSIASSSRMGWGEASLLSVVVVGSLL